MPDLYVSWSEYHQKIEILAAKICQSGWNFDQIICIAKGGLRVGDLLCRIYDVPLAILSASSYSGEENRLRGEITFSQHLSMVSDRLNPKILLVDDLADSGISLQQSIAWLQQHRGSEINEIRTAVIWHKASSVITPDYTVEYLPNNPWIHQPFEIYEQMTPEDFARRYPQFVMKDERH
ncbi:MAG: phosphoribosyltransferase [Chroococcales cyanobacterium]